MVWGWYISSLMQFGQLWIFRNLRAPRHRLHLVRISWNAYSRILVLLSPQKTNLGFLWWFRKCDLFFILDLWFSPITKCSERNLPLSHVNIPGAGDVRGESTMWRCSITCQCFDYGVSHLYLSRSIIYKGANMQSVEWKISIFSTPSPSSPGLIKMKFFTGA